MLLRPGALFKARVAPLVDEILWRHAIPLRALNRQHGRTLRQFGERCEAFRKLPEKRHGCVAFRPDESLIPATHPALGLWSRSSVAGCSVVERVMMTIEEFHQFYCKTSASAQQEKAAFHLDRTKSHIPLALAREQLGRAQFPESWSGFERVRPWVPDLPEAQNGYQTLLSHEPSANETARWISKPNDAAINYAEQILAAVNPAFAPVRPMLGMLVPGITLGYDT